jgi:hypothetical protein
MKKIKLKEKELTRIIERVINEQGRDPKPGPPSERSVFLTAYSQLQDDLYNMHWVDKQEVKSHNANEIIMGYRKNIKEIELRMENMCKQYEIARRAMESFEDDWVKVGSYSNK